MHNATWPLKSSVGAHAAACAAAPAAARAAARASAPAAAQQQQILPQLVPQLVHQLMHQLVRQLGLLDDCGRSSVSGMCVTYFKIIGSHLFLKDRQGRIIEGRTMQLGHSNRLRQLLRQILWQLLQRLLPQLMLQLLPRLVRQLVPQLLWQLVRQLRLLDDCGRSFVSGMCVTNCGSSCRS